MTSRIVNRIRGFIAAVSPPKNWQFPVIVILGAGYSFSRDYNQARGHYYAVEDIRKTLRTGVPQPVLTLIRHAQWRWDWVAAANAVGFHSPTEALRTLGTAIQKAQESHAKLVRILAKKGIFEPFKLPDVSTKEKAQRYIGLNMTNARAEKGKFLKEVVPLWDETARAREADY